MSEPLTEYDRERLDLGTQLRRQRMNAGLTGIELGERAGISQSKISKIETGRVTPSPEDVELLANALGLADETREKLIERATALATEMASWRFLNRQGVRKRQEEFHAMELAAVSIRLFQPLIIPGLLQTAAYIRAMLLRHAASTSTAFQPAAVNARIERQEPLYDGTKRFTFVILEAALRNRFGTLSDQLVQLDRIANVSSLPNVSVGIVPSTAELPRIPYNSFCIFETEDLVVTAETQLDFMIEHDPERVTRYVDEFEQFASVASFGDDGRSLIAGVIDSIREAAPKKRSKRVDTKMPIERYKEEDPLENHPLFKSEERARIEETMGGVDPDFSDEILEEVGLDVWPSQGLRTEAPPEVEDVTGTNAASVTEERGFWNAGDSRDFDWGD